MSSAYGNVLLLFNTENIILVSRLNIIKTFTGRFL